MILEGANDELNYRVRDAGDFEAISDAEAMPRVMNKYSLEGGGFSRENPRLDLCVRSAPATACAATAGFT